MKKLLLLLLLLIPTLSYAQVDDDGFTYDKAYRYRVDDTFTASKPK